MESFFTPTLKKLILFFILVALSAFLLFGGPFGVFCEQGVPCPQPWYASFFRGLSIAFALPFYLIADGPFEAFFRNSIGNGPATIVGLVATIAYLYLLSCILIALFTRLQDTPWKK